MPPNQPKQSQAQHPAQGVIADAIRNVQKYAQRDGFNNPPGGDQQEVAPSIQFDTKGVEFGPWLRRFVAQIRRNWFIPYAAMSMRGRVVVTFFVHKDGRITDVQVLRPSPIDAFNRSAQNAILASTPDAVAAAGVSGRQGVLHGDVLLQRDADRSDRRSPTRMRQPPCEGRS